MPTEQVGILAIQGGYHRHQQCIEKLGHPVVLVRNQAELTRITRLIIPGGESTTMTTLLKKHHLWQPLKQVCRDIPVMGTCAGSILMSRKAVSTEYDVLNLIDIEIERNHYGRQLDSFSIPLLCWLSEKPIELEATFIRAPAIVNYGSNVKILASTEQQPVLVQQNNYLAATFHPELSDNLSIHQYFMGLT